MSQAQQFTKLTLICRLMPAMTQPHFRTGIFTTLTTCALLLGGCDTLVGESDGSANQTNANLSQPATTTLSEGPFTIRIGDGRLVFEWDAEPEAVRYHLYVASEPFTDYQNYGVYLDSELHLDVTSPFQLTNLPNHRYATYLFTAEIDGQEVMLGQPMDLYPFGAEPTDLEVRLLELVNRARQDPTAEASRYGIALNEGLGEGTISPARKAPLAFNIPLMLASRHHNDWMLASNTLSHTGQGGSSVGDRADEAGYVLTAPGGLSENLAWLGTTAPTIDLTAAIETQHEGLFLSQGHRQNMLNEDFREAGIGQRQGLFSQNGTTYTSSIVTNKFGYSGGRYFLTGVAFEAAQANDLYQVGTALENVRIQIGDYRYAPYASGAFSVLLAPGSHDFSVTVAGGAVGTPEVIVVSDQNVKRDIVKHSGRLQIRTY